MTEEVGLDELTIEERRELLERLRANADAEASLTPAELVREVREVMERIVYAGLALGCTIVVIRVGNGLHVFIVAREATGEVAMLNAGLAFYSHAASGRVIRAFRAMLAVPVQAAARARPPTRRRAARRRHRKR